MQDFSVNVPFSSVSFLGSNISVLKTFSNCGAGADVVSIGELKKAIKAGIKLVSFDRNGYLYHGRVKSLADGAREAGLKF